MLPQNMQDFAKDGLLMGVGGFAAKKLVWDPINPLSYFRKDKASSFNDNSKGGNSQESDPKSHVDSPKNNIAEAKSQIETSRFNIENYTKNLDGKKIETASLIEKIYLLILLLLEIIFFS